MRKRRDCPTIKNLLHAKKKKVLWFTHTKYIRFNHNTIVRLIIHHTAITTIRSIIMSTTYNNNSYPPSPSSTNHHYHHPPPPNPSPTMVNFNCNHTSITPEAGYRPSISFFLNHQSFKSYPTIVAGGILTSQPPPTSSSSSSTSQGRRARTRSRS